MIIHDRRRKLQETRCGGGYNNKTKHTIYECNAVDLVLVVHVNIGTRL